MEDISPPSSSDGIPYLAEHMRARRPQARGEHPAVRAHLAPIAD